MEGTPPFLLLSLYLSFRRFFRVNGLPRFVASNFPKCQAFQCQVPQLLWYHNFEASATLTSQLLWLVVFASYVEPTSGDEICLPDT